MKRADDQIAAVRALAEKHPETWLLATSAADIRRAASEGKIAALLGLKVVMRSMTGWKMCSVTTILRSIHVAGVEREYELGGIVR